MKIKLIAVGKRMPNWIQDGVTTYSKRLQADCHFQVIEVDSTKQQSEKMLAAIHKDDYVIALDEHGQQYDSIELSRQFENLRQQGYDISLLIGGADGLTSECKQRANKIWSLSKLTLPHGLVRILVVEQIYRALSILKSHPYHRQ